MPIHDLLGRRRAAHPSILEKHPSLTVQQFLRTKGWQVAPVNAEVLKRSLDRQGEKSAADIWAIRRDRGFTKPSLLFTEILFIEVKRPKGRHVNGTKKAGGKLSEGQRTWAQERSDEGFDVVWCDDFDVFKEWYQQQFGE